MKASPYVIPGLFKPAPPKMKCWTAQEDALLAEVYSDMVTANIARMMQRSFKSIQMRATQKGLRKSDAFMQSGKAGNRGNPETLKAYSYKKGHRNPHRGMKQSDFMPPEAIEKCRATHFKKGIIPPCTKPVGTETVLTDKRINKSYRWKKMPDNTWRQVHYINWEAKNGPVPEGYVLSCKDKNTLNAAADNWVLTTRADMLSRNSVNNYPDDIRQAIIALRGFNKSLNHLMKNEGHK